MGVVDLHAHSTFSMLDGMGTPKEIVERAAELHWGAVCLTEHGWMGSAPALYQAAKANRWWKNFSGFEEGSPKPILKPIIGCELYVVPDEVLGQKGKEFRSLSYHLTVIALSAEGYHNLVAWTTFANQRENMYYNPRISLEAMADIAPYSLDNNVVLSGCLGGELCQSIISVEGDGISSGVAYVESLKSLFPNFYIEVQRHERKKFMGMGFERYEATCAHQAKANLSLLEIAEVTGTPVVVTNDSHYLRPEQRGAHLMMTAKKQGGYAPVAGNAQASYLPQYGYFTNYLQPMEKIAAKFKDGDEMLKNIERIVDMVDIRLEPLDDFKYSIPFSGYNDPEAKIRKRSAKRLKELKAIHGKDVMKRFELEIGVMGDFAHYLLAMSDFIRHAKKQGILTNTRGSAANSLVCYCLGIHDIDPMPGSYDLLFSRFVNPARKKFPDIDIDIDKDRYEDFMEYVKEYMAEREGEGQVVQISNYGTLANRSSFRLMADALGISKEEQDEIAKLLPNIIDSGMVDEENDVYEALKEEYPEIYELASGVFDSIRSISQHACGWLFGTRDRPIEKWVPLVLIASSGSLVTAYNMKLLDDMGLVKGDFLRLRTLSVIQRTRKLLGQSSLDITDIPLDDPDTFAMLREGRTEGIFTLQGKENRRGVMETDVENVHDVIKSVAIYRPALTREKKENTYNNRRRGQEEVDYPHKISEKVFGSTFGVPIFQEQVMELCYAVGMSDVQVDEVYQAIKKAKGVGRGAKEAFEEIKPKFLKAAKKSGIKKSIAEIMWRDVEGSQGYGFNKGHATSYGILAVRAAYLKCHHPAEFFTALLDVYPEKSKYVAAARAEGFKFMPPDVNYSERGFTLDPSGQIRVGLSRVKNIGPVAAQAIMDNAPYSDMDDFREKVPRSKVRADQLEILQTLGAFGSVGIDAPRDDVLEFKTLGFVLKKPLALKGKKAKHGGPRESESGWRHLGYEHGADLTDFRTSVSKMFWIPPVDDEKHFKLLDLKASPYAQIKTYLLHAVDENGIVFHIMANEDKKGDAAILNFIAKKMRGSVITVDGGIRKPFLTDGPMGFRFSGITGALFHNAPQVWDTDEINKDALVLLHQRRKGMNASGQSHG